jgi:hypothetical protein
MRHLRPGPTGGLLIQQGHNRHGDLGKLYFPEEGTFLRVRPDLFADEDPESIRSLHWAASCGRLVAATTQRLWAVPIERVLDEPRHRASDGRKIRKPG